MLIIITMLIMIIPFETICHMHIYIYIYTMWAPLDS